MSRQSPLLSEQSAAYLARVVNRTAASFDVAALSAEEAVEFYMLCDRITDALWREHKQVLLPLYQSLLTRLGVLEDDPQGTGGDSH